MQSPRDKRGRPYNVLAVPLFLGIPLLLGVFTLFSAGYGRSEPSVWSLVGVSPETVALLKRDEKLMKSYGDIVDLGASTAKILADRYSIPALARVSDDLNRHSRSIGVLQRRDPTGDLAKLFGGAAGGDGGAAAAASALGSMLTGGGNMTGLDAIGSMLAGGNMTSMMTAMMSSVMSMMSGNGSSDILGGAGIFLGIGLGAGAVQGLNLSTADNAKVVGARVAAQNNNSATGLNPMLQSAAMGATASLIGAVNTSSFNTSTIVDQAAPALLGLGQGLGGGTAMGLNLTQRNMAPDPNTTEVGGIAGNFGFGLTNSLVASINTTSLLQSATGSFGSGMLSKVAPALLGLGQGLGGGTAMGLNLTQQNMAPNPNATDVGGIADNFGFGLTSTLIASINTTSLLQSATGGINSDMVVKMLPAAAAGFGKGLGGGAAIGLGYQPDTPVPVQVMPDGSADVSGIAMSFSQGLTSSFLANGTVSKLVSSVGSSSVTSNLDYNRIAQGFARGFLQGAGDGIDSLGGVQALINGTATMPPPQAQVGETPMQFNDSVNGAATGFGQGLGSQGVMLVQKMLSGAPAMVSNTPTSNTPAPNLLASSTPTASNMTARSIMRRALPHARRQLDVSPGSNSLNVSLMLSSDTISSVLQKGADALTCEGIGGIGLMGLGLYKSGTISFDGSFDANTTKLIKGLIPQGIIRLVSGNTVYEIDGQVVGSGLDDGSSLLQSANGIQINGTKVIPFAVYLILHILIALVVMVNMFPAAMAFESLHNLLRRYVSQPLPPLINKFAAVNRMTWLFVMGPSLILLVVFGALAGGNASHFSTVHGILGLITAGVGLIAVALFVLVKEMAGDPGKKAKLAKVRTGVNQVLLLLTTATTISGFADLSAMVLCFTSIVSLDTAISIGFGLSSSFILGSTISGAEIFINWKASRSKAPSISEKVPLDPEATSDVKQWKVAGSHDSVISEKIALDSEVTGDVKVSHKEMK